MRSSGHPRSVPDPAVPTTEFADILIAGHAQAPRIRAPARRVRDSPGSGRESCPAGVVLSLSLRDGRSMSVTRRLLGMQPKLRRTFSSGSLSPRHQVAAGQGRRGAQNQKGDL